MVVHFMSVLILRISSGLQNLYAETYSQESRCIEHAGPWNATEGLRVTYSDAYGGGCYKVLHHTDYNYN